MSSINRRAFGARALGVSAAASAAYVGLSPAALAQFGSSGSGDAPTLTPVPSPTPDSGLPALPQGKAVTELTPAQFEEVDTSTEPGTALGEPVAVENSTFRGVAAPAGAYVKSVRQVNERTQFLEVWSPSNQRTMRVIVMAPPASFGPRPSLYCLDGYADWRPEGDPLYSSSWYWAGGGWDFFMDKNVNAVMPCDAGPSMYRDWVSPMPGRGVVKWETFLTKELPPLINAGYKGNGKNGIMGISSGATAAFMTSVRKRSLYNTVVGMSGLYDVDNIFGRSLWTLLWKQKNIDADWVMGNWFNNQWGSNDPYNWLNGNIQSLRGKTIYLSAASGLPTGEDWGDIGQNPDAVLKGGPFEATACNATKRYAAWALVNGVRVTQDYRLFGVHDWPLWTRQLPIAWPTIAKGLGVDGQRPSPESVVLRA